jgi:hypothetical protein
MARANQSRSQTRCTRLCTDNTRRAQDTTPNHLQESQRQQTLELEQKEIKEEDIFNEDKEKLIRHFKKIATSLKGEGCKYDWLEKPKTFNETHSKYQQFKQSIQWYLYT